MSGRPPEELSEWGALYRSARTPPAALKAAVRAQLRDDALEPAANEAPTRWGLGLAIGGLLGAAAVLALTCGLDALRSQQADDDTPDIAPMQHVPAPAGSVEPAAPSTKQPPPPSQPAPAAAPPPPSPAATPSARPAPSEPAPAAPSTNEDLASLRALRAAEKALRTDPARALSLLDRHEADFPNSKLFLEREALWIRAACRSGGAPGLDARRASFSRRADVGAYRAAVERDCTSE